MFTWDSSSTHSISMGGSGGLGRAREIFSYFKKLRVIARTTAQHCLLMVCVPHHVHVSASEPPPFNLTPDPPPETSDCLIRFLESVVTRIRRRRGRWSSQRLIRSRSRSVRLRAPDEPGFVSADGNGTWQLVVSMERLNTPLPCLPV